MYDERCCDGNSNSIIICEENKMKFEILNKDKVEVCKYKVDGCLISDKKAKCDYFVLVEGKSRAMLIELKGQDRKRAIS